ncbi:hypothetical protein OROHE_006280 [Orobanche hederae]
MEDSMDSSGLASGNSMDQEETSTLVVTESKPSEWTNEKHCLFIKSMETTFVDQLYKSLDLSGWHSHKNSSTGSKSSKHKLNSIRASSGQFKVLRDGCWSKLDFRGDEPEVDENEESKVPMENQWIQHYRNWKIQANRKIHITSKAPLTTTEDQYFAHNFQLCCQDSVGSNAEGTDQNFNDDEALQENKSRKIRDTKKVTTTTDTVASNDQVIEWFFLNPEVIIHSFENLV